MIISARGAKIPGAGDPCQRRESVTRRGGGGGTRPRGLEFRNEITGDLKAAGRRCFCTVSRHVAARARGYIDSGGYGSSAEPWPTNIRVSLFLRENAPMGPDET